MWTGCSTNGGRCRSPPAVPYLLWAGFWIALVWGLTALTLDRTDVRTLTLGAALGL
jgi:hypothetical protein